MRAALWLHSRPAIVKTDDWQGLCPTRPQLKSLGGEMPPVEGPNSADLQGIYAACCAAHAGTEGGLDEWFPPRCFVVLLESKGRVMEREREEAGLTLIPVLSEATGHLLGMSWLCRWRLCGLQRWDMGNHQHRTNFPHSYFLPSGNPFHIHLSAVGSMCH